MAPTDILCALATISMHNGVLPESELNSQPFAHESDVLAQGNLENI